MSAFGGKADIPVNLQFLGRDCGMHRSKEFQDVGNYLADVAFLSHGFSERRCNRLKQQENACNILRQRKELSSNAKLLFYLAVPRGLEPPTFGLGNRCSIRLSYGTSRGHLLGLFGSHIQVKLYSTPAGRSHPWPSRSALSLY